ncbi:MAG: Ig-like domain-containing protein [Clostridiaceae bacterium]|nr:Ig-like domain-containing protein [Clostridiaceae bacterium]
MKTRSIFRQGSLLPCVRLSMLLCILFSLVLPSPYAMRTANAKTPVFVILSAYRMTMKIGEEQYLAAIATNAKTPSFKSSNTKIASVNSYGLITAKAAGTCKITAKTSSAEASCRITVSKTTIRLNHTALSLEHGESVLLKASTSNGSTPVYRSSKKSVATVDEDGMVTAVKPGTSTISVTADKSSVSCKVTVKNPTITLSKTSHIMYRRQTLQLTAAVSSGIEPVWKSSKSSVATVDETGLVTAYKHGTAIIRATVDGITRSCEITVAAPTITLSDSEITLQAGKSKKLGMTCSSPNSPIWKSSKKAVVTVDQNGILKAKKSGTAIISVTEDGTKETCTVRVTA